MSSNPTDAFTLCPRLGQSDGHGQPLVTPLVLSTTYCRDDIDADVAHAYSRESNPTVAALEHALGQLEDAPDAACFATGLAAETALFLTLLKQGDHVACSRACYGGTTRLLEQVLSGLGVQVDFVDTSDLDAVAAVLRPNTRLLLAETPANPTLLLSDLRALADLAHANGTLLAVDNTFLTPALQQPLELGADVSVTSTTKFIEGHSAALGGALVTRDEDLLDRIRFVRKCTGAIQSPLGAWLTLQGLKTLPLRLQRQSETAGAIATWLAQREDVELVHYPGLPDFPQAALARRQHRGAHGAVVSFEPKGGATRARELVRQLKLARLVEHVGSVETLVTHSASMTHGGVRPEEREAVGVTDGLLRLSIGLEPAETLIADLEQALAFSRVATEGGASCPAVA
ncbi:MAG: aminotransferase class I/II-fold pyridoxal phosphate-dependent enzyme [Acidobacteriota bacterium]